MIVRSNLFMLLILWAQRNILHIRADGAAGEFRTPLQLSKAPFWRQQLRPCGLRYKDSSSFRPHSCFDKQEFCHKDPYQPSFDVCTPCWRACLECTRSAGPRNNSGITRADCSACGCPFQESSGQRCPCRRGSYCGNDGLCHSCYECLDDLMVRGGSCRTVCGHAPRPSLPAFFELPYDPANSSEWVVEAAMELDILFRQAVGNSHAVGWLDLGEILNATGLDLPPDQLMYAVLQLTRANATDNGIVPDRLPGPPSPPLPPPWPPRPPPRPPQPPPSPPGPINASALPAPSPALNVSNISSGANGSNVSGSSGGGLRRELRLTAEPSHDLGLTTRHSSSHIHRAERLLQQAVVLSAGTDANPLLAAIYPEDFVRVFLHLSRDAYDVFCPNDVVIFGSGVSYPGCACMSIPPEFQDDTSLVSGTTRQWVDYLAMVAGSNRTTANAICPQGYRCSAPNFQQMRHLFARSYVPAVMGICVPCLVGEYCPAGTVEKSQEIMETCSRRSALYSSGDSGSGSSGSNNADCGNTRLCPAGSYCPLPSEILNCTQGNFCTEGSTEPTTCSFELIISEQPFAPIKPKPSYVLTEVTAGSPLSGNYCPEGSEDPFSYCPEGYYCPKPGTRIICPRGYYCQSQSTSPQRCGFLLSCNDEGTSDPQVAWWGVLVFVILLCLLPVLGIIYSIYQERAMRRTVHDDKLLEALFAMGFGAVGGDGDTDDDEDEENDHGWLRPDPRRRGWRQRFRDWFRRRILLRTEGSAMKRRHSSASWGPSPRSGKSYKSDKSDLESILQPAADHLPPGFDHISPFLTIQFENLSLKLRSGRRILDNVSGDFPHSHLHAIMGPSGSGKSSFISALIGKASGGIITGNVAVWRCETQDDELGQPCSFEEIRYLTGFVPQDDVVHETMTVRENLFYSAALRLPQGTPLSQREAAVRGVLSMLGMAHVQHDVVGNVGRKGLSGGQRKRLNIGLELVAKPCLLMLDEPTSGLDAAVSHDVVLALKHMAEAGMNVMVVIHQPRYSIFEMFDSVLLLGVGGRTVFLGPVNLAEAYFNFLGFRPPPNENRADFYLDVISGAVWRDDDEDFVPNELFTVWQEVGCRWLYLTLTDPNFGEEEEEVEAEEGGEYGDGAEGGCKDGREAEEGRQPPFNSHNGEGNSEVLVGPSAAGGAMSPTRLRSRRAHGAAHSRRRSTVRFNRTVTSLDFGSSDGGGGYDDDTGDPGDAASCVVRQRLRYRSVGSSDVIAATMAGVVVTRTSSASSSGGGGGGWAGGPRRPVGAIVTRRSGLAAFEEHPHHQSSSAHPRTRFSQPPPVKAAGADADGGSCFLASGDAAGGLTSGPPAEAPAVGESAGAAATAGATLAMTDAALNTPAHAIVGAVALVTHAGLGTPSDHVNPGGGATAAVSSQSGSTAPLTGSMVNGDTLGAVGFGAGSGGTVRSNTRRRSPLGEDDHRRSARSGLMEERAGGLGNSGSVWSLGIRGSGAAAAAAVNGDGGIAGAEGPTQAKTAGSGRGSDGLPEVDVPASRRFLAKVESLKEAGVNTLVAAGSMRARGVLEGTGSSGLVRSFGRRQTRRTASHMSTQRDIEAMAAAAVASVDAEREQLEQQQSKGAALQAQPVNPGADGLTGPTGAEVTSPPRTSRSCVSPNGPKAVEHAAGHDPMSRARAQWNRLRKELPSMVSSGGGARLGGGADNSPGTAAGGSSGGTRVPGASGGGLRASHSPGASSGAAPLARHSAGDGGDVASPAKAVPEHRLTPARQRWQRINLRSVVLHGSELGDRGEANAAGNLMAAPGEVQVQAKRGAVAAPGGTAPPNLSMAELLKMSRDVQQRRTEGGRLGGQAGQRNKTAAAPAAAGAGPRKDASGGGGAAGGQTGQATSQAQAGTAGGGGSGGGGPLERMQAQTSEEGRRAPTTSDGKRTSTGMADSRQGNASLDHKGEPGYGKPGGKGGCKAAAPNAVDILKITREAARKDAAELKERQGYGQNADDGANQGRSLLETYRLSMRRAGAGGDAFCLPDSITAEVEPPAAAASTGSNATLSGGAAGAVVKKSVALLGEVPMLQDNEEEVEEMAKRIYAEKPRLTHLSKVLPWRPKDLQAIQDNFDLIDVGGSKALSYDEFLYFFAALRKLLPERHFRKFVEETVDHFDLHEDSVVTRDVFLEGIKARLKESTLPADYRRRKRRRHIQEQDGAERRRRLDAVLRRIRKLKVPTDHEEADDRRSLADYWQDLRAHFRRMNESITRKHRSTRAAKKAGVANPLMVARMQSVVMLPMSSTVMMTSTLTPMTGAAAAAPSGTSGPATAAVMGNAPVVTGSQALLRGDLVAPTGWSYYGLQYGDNAGSLTINREGDGGAAVGSHRAGNAAGGTDGDWRRRGQRVGVSVAALREELAPTSPITDSGKLGVVHERSPLPSPSAGPAFAQLPSATPLMAAPASLGNSPDKFVSPFALECNQCAADGSFRRPGSRPQVHMRKGPSALILRTSSSLANPLFASHAASPTAGGGANGVSHAASRSGVHMAEMARGTSTSASGASTLARAFGSGAMTQASAGPLAASGNTASVSASVMRSPGRAPDGSSELVTGGSITHSQHNECSAQRLSKRLQVILTPGGRVSTDISALEIGHVLSGRVSKSITARAGSLSSPTRGSAGLQATRPVGVPKALEGLDPQQVAAIVAAANRMGSTTAGGGAGCGGRVGSITGAVGGGRAESIAAGVGFVRLGSITAGATRVGSITAEGAHRAPGVMVISGGRVGSITATGRVSSIAAPQHSTARMRQRQSYYRASEVAFGAEPDDASGTLEGVGGGAGLGLRGSMVMRGSGVLPAVDVPRADKESVHAVLTRLRAEKNIDPVLLKQQEKEAAAAAAAGARVLGARQRRQSLMLSPQVVELEFMPAGQSAPLGPLLLSPETAAVATVAAGASVVMSPAAAGALLSVGSGTDNSSALPLNAVQAQALPSLPLSTIPTIACVAARSHMSAASVPRLSQRFLMPANSVDAAGAAGAGGNGRGGHVWPGSRVTPVQVAGGSRSTMSARLAPDGRAHLTDAALAGPCGSLPCETPGVQLTSSYTYGENGEMEGGGGGDGGLDGGQAAVSINCCVLLGYYISYYSTVAWAWLSLRVRHFVASLLGHERGGRALPSVGRQIYLVWRRSAIKFLNERTSALLDMSLVIMLGLVMGAIQGHVSNITKVPETSILVILAFAITSLVTGLRTFGQEQLIFLTREAQAGLSVMSWMAGRFGWDLLLQGIYPALYLGFYYAMTVFDTPFELYYLVLFFVAWWGFGVGYLFSVLLEANNALLGGLCVTLIFGGVVNGINPTVASAEGNALLTGLQYLSYTRWAVEAVFIATATPTDKAMVFVTAGALSRLGFCDMNHQLGSIEGGLEPADLAIAFQPVIEQRYNVTLQTNAPNSTSNSKTVGFLYRVYEDPNIVDHMCRNSFMTDILWLLLWGGVTRIAAFLVLLYKVERRMTTASLFG